MSNIYKGARIVSTSSNSVIIDSNEKVMTRLEEIREKMMAAKMLDKNGFVEGLDAQAVEVLVDDEPSVEEQEEVMNEEQAGETARELVHKAKQEADNIINNAQIRAKELHEKALKDGYDDGYEKAKSKIDEIIAKKEKEYDERKQALEEEYRAMRAKMEPELVDTLVKVFDKVTRALADCNKNTILHLVQNVMRNAEISKDFLIKVSKDDYKFMLNNKEKLYEHVSPSVRIEIYQDATLSRNQCIIETDAGVFDCSLDIQLENLIRELKTLSCMVE